MLGYHKQTNIGEVKKFVTLNQNYFNHNTNTDNRQCHACERQKKCSNCVGTIKDNRFIQASHLATSIDLKYCHTLKQSN